MRPYAYFRQKLCGLENDLSRERDRMRKLRHKMALVQNEISNSLMEYQEIRREILNVQIEAKQDGHTFP